MVKRAAAEGHQWAVKLLSKGWASLSKNQKALARASGVGAPLPSVIVPRTIRVMGGNPTRSRRSPDSEGGALKSMTITKQEFVGSVHASKSVRTFLLDPRNVGTFPQLSSLALGYNKYRFTSLRLRYSPRCSESSCGIIATWTSDSSDPAPLGKYQMYGTTPKYECSATKPMLAMIPVDKGTKFLRDCSSDDAKLVDCGAIHVLADGEHDGVLGELFIEFSIVLSEPTFNQASTQYVSDGAHRKGPEFVMCALQGRRLVVTLRAGGNYMCSVFSDPVEKLSKMKLEEATHLSVDGADKSTSIIEMVASEPGASIVIDFKSKDACAYKLYISRV